VVTQALRGAMASSPGSCWWAVPSRSSSGSVTAVLVMFHWAWSWLTFQRGARLINRRDRRPAAGALIGPDGRVALPPGASAVALRRGGPPRPVPPAPPDTARRRWPGGWTDRRAHRGRNG